MLSATAGSLAYDRAVPKSTRANRYYYPWIPAFAGMTVEGDPACVPNPKRATIQTDLV